MTNVRVERTATGRAHIEAAVEDFVRHVTGEIAEDARRLAPKETGALAAGIEPETAGTTGRVSVDRNVPGDDPRVPIYVELGTENMRAQPYLRPALYKKRGHDYRPGGA